MSATLFHRGNTLRVGVSQVGGKSSRLSGHENAATNYSAKETGMDLSPEQEAEARRLFELLHPPVHYEAKRLARRLAANPDDKLRGQTAFEVRDAVHRLGASALPAARDGRNQGGSRGRAGPVRPARPMPAARAF